MNDWISMGSVVQPECLIDIYVNLVKSIFKWTRMYEESYGTPLERSLRKQIRDLFMFGVLDTNVYTGEPIVRSQKRDTNRDTVKYALLTERVNIRLVEFITKFHDDPFARLEHPYILLERILELGKTKTYLKGDDAPLWSLIGLWSLCPRPEVTDSQIMRACLRIRLKSIENSMKDKTDTLCNDSLIPYIPDLVKELKRVFLIRKSTQEIANDMSYLGLFDALVHTQRLAPDDQEVKQILSEEVCVLVNRVND